MFKKNKRVKSSSKNLKNCLNGINYAIEKEHNLIYIMCYVAVILILMIILPVNNSEILAIVITSGMTFSFELINTSIEAVVDLCTTKQNDLAKVSKDCAGASLFIMTIVSIITNLVIFIPKIIQLF